MTSSEIRTATWKLRVRYSNHYTTCTVVHQRESVILFIVRVSVFKTPYWISSYKAHFVMELFAAWSSMTLASSVVSSQNRLLQTLVLRDIEFHIQKTRPTPAFFWPPSSSATLRCSASVGDTHNWSLKGCVTRCARNAQQMWSAIESWVLRPQLDNAVYCPPVWLVHYWTAP